MYVLFEMIRSICFASSHFFLRTRLLGPFRLGLFARRHSVDGAVVPARQLLRIRDLRDP
jgi:hypothetical protein